MQKLPPRATVGFVCDGTDRNIDLAAMQALFAKAPALSWLALPARSAMHLARHNIRLPSKPLIFTQLDMVRGTEENDMSYQLALESFRPAYLLAPLTLPVPLTPPPPPMLDRLHARVQAHNRQFGGALLLAVPYLNIKEPIHKEQAFEAVAHVVTDIAIETGAKLAINLAQLFAVCQYHKLRPRVFIDALKAETIALIEIGDGAEPICHEVWVLYTHLLGLIGPRPTLIGTYRGAFSLSSLLADMGRADDRLNATRTLGPQLGTSHVIFE